MDGVGVDKGNLQAEHADPRDGVDQLDTVGRETCQRETDIVDLVRQVVNAWPAPREEASHRRVLAGWREQLDPAPADEDGRRLDTLLGDGFAVLEGGPEEADIGLDGLVEVGDSDADVMDAARVHARDATARRPAQAAAGWHR